MTSSAAISNFCMVIVYHSLGTPVYSLQFLFKSTHHSWRYGRKCEGCFFWTQCIFSFPVTMNLTFWIHICSPVTLVQCSVNTIFDGCLIFVSKSKAQDNQTAGVLCSVCPPWEGHMMHNIGWQSRTILHSCANVVSLLFDHCFCFLFGDICKKKNNFYKWTFDLGKKVAWKCWHVIEGRVSCGFWKFTVSENFIQ